MEKSAVDPAYERALAAEIAVSELLRMRVIAVTLAVLLVADQALFLFARPAIEQFLQLQGKSDKLAPAQKHMSIVLDKVTTFLENVQKTSKPPLTGLCDSFNLGGESAAELTKEGEEKRSLLAQGLAVRGLLAAKRAAEPSRISRIA